MKLNRKEFFVSLGGLGLVAAAGCQTGPWTEDETAKLVITLEQAGLVLALALGKKLENRKYLELAASSLETIVADGKLDPSDVVAIILANVNNTEVALGVTTALAIYRIWWNDNPASTTKGVEFIAALARGLRNGLSSTTAKSFTRSAKVVVPSFKSKSLDNAVKDFFRRYDK